MTTLKTGSASQEKKIKVHWPTDGATQMKMDKWEADTDNG